jgi:hypothetical protein
MCYSRISLPVWSLFHGKLKSPLDQRSLPSAVHQQHEAWGDYVRFEILRRWGYWWHVFWLCVDESEVVKTGEDNVLGYGLYWRVYTLPTPRTTYSSQYGLVRIFYLRRKNIRMRYKVPEPRDNGPGQGTSLHYILLPCSAHNLQPLEKKALIHNCTLLWRKSKTLAF